MKDQKIFGFYLYLISKLFNLVKPKFWCVFWFFMMIASSFLVWKGLFIQASIFFGIACLLAVTLCYRKKVFQQELEGSDRMVKNCMANVAGLDIGFSESKKTNGVAWWVGGELTVPDNQFNDAAIASIKDAGPFAVIAIDGPIVSSDIDGKIKRKVESIFIRGKFSKRCKPGMSHSGMGLTLRKVAGKSATKLQDIATLSGPSDFPQIRAGSGIIEAFPNAFLGVCLDDGVYANKPPTSNSKFDWLYDQAIEQNIISRMSGLSGQEQKFWQAKLASEFDHDKRAALVCVLLALLVARNHYVAVGDAQGGWFFLPPLSAWADWAKCEVHKQIERMQQEDGLNIEWKEHSG